MESPFESTAWTLLQQNLVPQEDGLFFSASGSLLLWLQVQPLLTLMVTVKEESEKAG